MRNNLRKLRREKKTILVVCEGPTDKTFLDYLKNLFMDKEKISIRVKESNGGGYKGVLRKLFKIIKNIEYNFYLIIVDSDRKKEEKIISDIGKELKENEMDNEKKEIILNIPCLEGFLLKILEPKKEFSHLSSNECKNIFKKKLKIENILLDDKICQKLFDKNVIKISEKKIKNLNKIIKIFKGGF
jgi:ribosomal protein L31E